MFQAYEDGQVSRYVFVVFHYCRLFFFLEMVICWSIYSSESSNAQAMNEYEVKASLKADVDGCGLFLSSSLLFLA